MLEWVKITLILCIFGTLREIRPSEPFVTEFLSGEWRNVTSEQLFRDVYPVATYSYMTLLVVVFLITDFLRFKPVIILSGLSGISIYVILLWTRSIEWLQVSQVLFGLYMATEIAYYTYMYAKVEAEHYPRVSSCARAAALAGRFVSGAAAQLLVHAGLMDYRQLNYITLAAQVFATMWALWLPPVLFGIYFNRRSSIISNMQQNLHSPNNKPLPPAKRSLRASVSQAGALVARHARAAYSRPRVLAWSALYAAALALFTHAQTYIQVLWQDIQRDQDERVAYNGAVEAAQTLLGAAGALAAGGAACARAALPAAAAAAQAAAVLLGARAPHIFVSYACYVLTGTLYHFTITLASAKIASQLSDESCFGLIFGINTFVGTAAQALLTLALNQALALPPAGVYYVLSGGYALLAGAWLLGCALRARPARAAEGTLPKISFNRQ